MPRIVCLRGERIHPKFQWSQYFIVEDRVERAEMTLRQAITDYLTTPRAKNVIDGAGGEPNWGDINSSYAMSANWLKPYGLTPCDDIEEISVNHDEVLYHDSEDE